MIKKTPLIGAACALALGALFSGPAAATEQLDILTGLNTLPFLLTKIAGDTTMAVIYDPANSASKADAEGIKRIIDSGITITGGGKISAMLVGVDDLEKLSRARIAFLTPGLAAYFADINIVASAASILTISTDIDCVKAATCIIGVTTAPNVEIYYSKSAADAAKIEFSQAFVLLVRHL